MPTRKAYSVTYTGFTNPIDSGASGLTTGGTGNRTLTLSGDTFSSRIGRGDKFTIDVNGTPEVVYIESRNSDTQLTAQSWQSVGAHSNQDWKAERCYKGLSTAEAATDNDLVSADEIVELVAYDDGDFGEGEVIIAGATVDATRYRVWTVAVGERHQGKYNASVGVLYTPWGNGIAYAENYGILEWFQMYRATEWAINLDSDGGKHVIVRNNIVKGFSDGGIRSFASGGSGYIANNIIFDSTGNGIYSQESTEKIYNNTVHNCGYGIRAGSGSPIAKNNIAMDCATACYSGTFGTSSNNMSSDTSAPGTSAQKSKVSTNQFVNTAGDDFHLKAGADAINNGTSLTGESTGYPDNVDIDIDAYNRNTGGVVWDIGAHEYLSAVTAKVTCMDNDYRRQRIYYK
jgi:parallel beta-helix repeat protein